MRLAQLMVRDSTVTRAAVRVQWGIACLRLQARVREAHPVTTAAVGNMNGQIRRGGSSVTYQPGSPRKAFSKFPRTASEVMVKQPLPAKRCELELNGDLRRSGALP
jgi:hypothetical protein